MTKQEKDEHITAIDPAQQSHVYVYYCNFADTVMIFAVTKLGQPTPGFSIFIRLFVRSFVCSVGLMFVSLDQKESLHIN